LVTHGGIIIAFGVQSYPEKKIEQICTAEAESSISVVYYGYLLGKSRGHGGCLTVDISKPYDRDGYRYFVAFEVCNIEIED
jgi:hypothetical protein